MRSASMASWLLGLFAVAGLLATTACGPPVGAKANSGVTRVESTTAKPEDSSGKSTSSAAGSENPVTTHVSPSTGKQGTGEKTGMISITFDDGYKSTVERAAPILAKYKYTATIAPVLNLVDTPGFVQKADLVRLHDAGWEIASHAVTHKDLTKMPLNEAESELVRSQAALREMDLGPVNVFVPPNSAWTAELRDYAKAYYKVVAIGTDRVNEIPLAERARVHRVSIGRDTSLEFVYGLIDQAVANKWVVLEFHGVDTPNSPYTVSSDFLNKVLERIQSSGVPVRSLSCGYDLATGGPTCSN